ncbi:acyl- synthetase [Nannochloropsis gaditana]|uniref:Acyl-synthetase n=1 Tax=Nannochloropsis gaditana TaxID=72520 RepID=W7U6N2_9STRA|nr:acyl- synthetase [Nannochloropsis gaditana]
MMRGNTVMSGYLKNEAATEATFHGGWMHTGDIAVAHKNGRIQLKVREGEEKGDGQGGGEGRRGRCLGHGQR